MSDQIQREQCLNPAESFIVQAPAGSGKTSLLIQRYLTLLSLVENHPEEVIAITFTRKAAQEMRERVVDALNHANDIPKNEFEAKTLDLAKKVLIKDKQLNWQLILNPARLKIQTIDSLATSITKRLPIAAQFGGQVDISDDPYTLYEQAVEQLFANECDALKIVLRHLDNNWNLIKVLLGNLLAMREQWISYVLSPNEIIKKILEQSIQLEITNQLTEAYDLLPENANNFATLITSKPWPKPEHNNLNQWLDITNIIFTATGGLRKTLTKKQGFVSTCPNSKEIKKQAIEWIQHFAHYPEFTDKLHTISKLPNTNYSLAEWDVIEAILTVLKNLTGYLKIAFQKEGQVDFTEVSLAAIHALGDDLEPTDLALQFGYSINHLLIDEFQDTSRLQFQLISKLISSWDESDNRSIFLVGDPKQSIYSFRQAEVNLFLSIQENQYISNKPVIPISLTRNFRSSTTIVTWFNQLFSSIFPHKNDLTINAVKFDASTASKKEPNSYVKVKKFTHNDTLTTSIVDIIKLEQQKNNTIAILVRSRNHLKTLIPALNNANINFQGIDLEPLKNKSVVQDLLALTSAILHIGDKISWLAILRAPWCGLLLQDLHVLSHGNILWQNICDPSITSKLTPNGKQRLQHFSQAMAKALDRLGHLKIKDLIYNLWIDLKGPISTTEIEYANQYFDFLADYINDPRLYQTDFLSSKLDKLYAKSSTHKNAVQIMTIHKAKGLEFDTVILPYLDKRPTYADPQLILWQEKTYLNNNCLLFAPIKSSFSKENKVYDYIKLNIKQKLQMEALRLLYVAITRSKSRLYCLGNIEHSKNSFFDLADKGLSEYEFIDDEVSLVADAKEEALLTRIKDEVLEV